LRKYADFSLNKLAIAVASDKNLDLNVLKAEIGFFLGERFLFLILVLV